MNPSLDPTAVTILFAVWIVGCLAFLIMAGVIWLLESRWRDWVDRFDRLIWRIEPRYRPFDFEVAEQEFLDWSDAPPASPASPADEQYPAA